MDKDIPAGEVKTAIAELIIKELLNALITGVLNCGQDKNRITPLIQDQGMKYICTIVSYGFEIFVLSTYRGVGLIRTMEIAKKSYELARSYELAQPCKFDEKIGYLLRILDYFLEQRFQ